MVPKPYQQPTPPIRIAASTPDTFPAIGSRGMPIFASVRHTSWSDLAGQIASYHEAWEAAGHPGRGQVFVSAPTYLAATEEQARAEPKPSIMHFYHEQANLLEGAAKLVDPETAARRMRRVHELRRRAYDDALDANALIGTPDHDRREARGAAGRDRIERHPRRIELRRADPARKGGERDAPVVRRGNAPLRPAASVGRMQSAVFAIAGARPSDQEGGANERAPPSSGAARV